MDKLKIKSDKNNFICKSEDLINKSKYDEIITSEEEKYIRTQMMFMSCTGSADWWNDREKYNKLYIKLKEKHMEKKIKDNNLKFIENKPEKLGIKIEDINLKFKNEKDEYISNILTQSIDKSKDDEIIDRYFRPLLSNISDKNKKNMLQWEQKNIKDIQFSCVLPATGPTYQLKFGSHYNDSSYYGFYQHSADHWREYKEIYLDQNIKDGLYEKIIAKLSEKEKDLLLDYINDKDSKITLSLKKKHADIEEIIVNKDRLLVRDICKPHNGQTIPTMYWSIQPGRFVDRNNGHYNNNNKPEFTGTFTEWFLILIDTIMEVDCQQRYESVNNPYASYLCCGEKIAKMLMKTNNFISSNETSEKDSLGFCGTLENGRYELYINNMLTDRIVLCSDEDKTLGIVKILGMK